MSFNDIINGIVKVATALTPFALAWIAYKQFKIGKQINGQQELLLKATGAKEHAAGKVEGKTEQRNEGKETAKEVIKQIQEDEDIQITKT